MINFIVLNVRSLYLWKLVTALKIYSKAFIRIVTFGRIKNFVDKTFKFQSSH